MNPEDPWATPSATPQATPLPSPGAPDRGLGRDDDSWSAGHSSDYSQITQNQAGNQHPSTVYLLHFSQPYKHARHYSGVATDLNVRLSEHEKGNGARLLQVAKEAGITWKLARTWPGGRDRERQLKNQGGASRRCPECGVTPRSPRAEPELEAG